MATTKYVGFSSDSPDYICDGADDQVQINQAFAWAANNPGSIIYMKGNHTYVISGQIKVSNNTEWTGDSTAIVRVANTKAANFPDGTPVITGLTAPAHDIKIHGFQLDGNCVNQSNTLGSAHGKSSSAGSGYERLVQFNGSPGSHVKNIYFYSMSTKNAFGEAFIVRYGENIQAYTNNCSNHQHEAICYKSCMGSGNIIQNNTVAGINSDCLRCDNCKNIDISGNTLTSYTGTENNGATERGENGIQIGNAPNYPELTDNINIYNNVINGHLTGIWLDDALKKAGTTAQNVHIHHNRLTGNGYASWAKWAGGIGIQWGNGVIIEKNTIENSYCDGINIYSYITSSACTISIKNNNITGTTKQRAGSSGYPSVLGYGIANQVSTKITVDAQGNYSSSNISGNYYHVTPKTEATALISDAIPGSGSTPTQDDPPTPNEPESVEDKGIYVPQISSIIDDAYWTIRDEDDYSAYINQIPFDLVSFKGRGTKLIGESKSPSIAGSNLDDFDFEGSDVTLKCISHDLDNFYKVLAAIYKRGRSVIELGGPFKGYKITGMAETHEASFDKSAGDIPERDFEYTINFKCERPYMEKINKRARGKYISESTTFSSDDCYSGNLVKNPSFERWTTNTTMNWITRTPYADNELRSICYSPELNLFCAVAASGTSDTFIVISNDGKNWRLPTGLSSLSNRNSSWRAIKWCSGWGVFIACAISGTLGHRVTISYNGDDWIAIATPSEADGMSWGSIVWIPPKYTPTVLFLQVGSGPRGICINSDNSKVYTVNGSGNSVSVINTGTNSVSATISVGINPFGCCISSDNSKVYIINFGGNSVSVIDTSTNSVSATISVGTSPYECCINSDNSKVYVTNYNNSSVSVIDTGTNSVSATIPVGANPRGICISSDNSKVYVANGGGNSVSVIDTGTNSVSATISVGANPLGICISSDNSKVYVANWGGNSVSVIDTGTNSVSTTFSVGTNPFGICINSDNSKVYVTNYENSSVSVVDTSTNSVSTTFSVGTNPFGICISSNDSKIYVANYGGHSVSIIENTIIPNGRVVLLAYAGTGDRVMFSDDICQTWTRVPSANDNVNWLASAYSPELERIVAVSYAGNSAQQAMYSNDFGDTWSISTTPTPNQKWTDIKWISLWGLFVACSEDGGPHQIMTSPSGVSDWTLRTTPYSSSTTSGGGDLVQSDYGVTPDGYSYTTLKTDYMLEYTFTLAALSGGSIYRINKVSCQMKIANSGGTASVKATITAASINSGAETILTEWQETNTTYQSKSTDLAQETATNEQVTIKFYIKTNNTSYKAIATLFSYEASEITSTGSAITYHYNGWRALAFAAAINVLICVGNSGSGNRVMYCTNPSTWYLGKTPADNNWVSACYSDKLQIFVACATTGTGNGIMTCEGYGTLSIPEGWTIVNPVQERTTLSVADGKYALKLSGDGSTEQPGMITQVLAFNQLTDVGEMYIFSVCGYVQGLTAGKFVADLYAGSTLIKQLNFDVNSDGYIRNNMRFRLDQIPKTVYIRIHGEDTPNNGSVCYFDDILVSKEADVDITQTGKAIYTDGYYDVIPDVSVRGIGSVASSPTSSRVTDYDYTSPEETTWETSSKEYGDPILTVTFPKLTGGSKYKINSLSFKIKSSNIQAYTYINITIQAASLFSGVETALAMWTSDKIDDWFEKTYTLPYVLESATNEEVTLKYYIHISNTLYSGYATSLGYDVSEILDVVTTSSSGIYLYNSADTSKVMHCCNKLPNGYMVQLKSNYSGSYRYYEPFVDDTYIDNAYAISGTVSRNSKTNTLVMASGSSITFTFDTLCPVTGIPFLSLYVVTGLPRISIADDSGDDGAPGTFYYVDTDDTSDIENLLVQWSLENRSNLQLRGHTKYYVKIEPQAGKTCEYTQFLEYANIDTMDIERFYIYNALNPNEITVVVDGGGKCSAIVDLSYYDANLLP